MKIQTTDWEKILANHISDKGLAPRICITLKTQQKGKPSDFFLMVKRLNRYSTKDPWLANKHMKRFLTSSVIRKMEIKTIVRSQLYTHYDRVRNQKASLARMGRCFIFGRGSGQGNVK